MSELFDNGVLNECPCCEGHSVDVTVDYRDCWAGICHGCDWYGPPGNDTADAIDRWNALPRRAALAAAEQRLANAARQADHDAGVIADLSSKLAAAEARAERAEQAHAHVEGMCLIYRAAMWAVIAKPGDTNPIRRVLMLPDEDGTLHDAALRGGEAQP